MLAPCFPAFVGFHVLPECTGKKYGSQRFSTGLKLVLATFQSRAYAFVLAHTVFIVAAPASFSCFAIKNFLLLVKKKALDIPGSPITQIIQMQREIDLLVTEYNNIHRARLLPAFSMCMSLCFIACSYGLIKYGQNLELPLKLFYIFTIVDVLILLIDCDGGMKGQVYKTSEEINKAIKNCRKVTRNLEARKFVRSWQTQKIQLGSVDVYKPSTTLNSLESNVANTINLLLA